MMNLPFKLEIDCIIAWIPAKPATLPLLPLSKLPSSTDACSCIIVTKNERNESNQVGLLFQMHICFILTEIKFYIAATIKRIGNMSFLPFGELFRDTRELLKRPFLDGPFKFGDPGEDLAGDAYKRKVVWYQDISH